jgi:GNAT superfamily N-acetyltransferase
MIFRDARRDELPAIVALLADDILGADRETGPDDAYQNAFDDIAADPRSRLIVADVEGQVAGTLQLTLIPGLSRHGMLRAQIEGVRVAAPWRGQGVGRALIGWAIEEARRRGCGLVQLTSDKRRADAIRFYEALGFTPTHEGLKLSLLARPRTNRRVSQQELTEGDIIAIGHAAFRLVPGELLRRTSRGPVQDR